MLKIISKLSNKNNQGHKIWICECSCGDISKYTGTRVKNGYVTDCITCSRSRCAEKNKTHGMRYSAEYKIWSGIKQRCTNPKSSDYKRYGGNGILLFKEWEKSFEAFFSYIGTRPNDEYSIDRIDNSKGYLPGNIRWATKKEQARNKNISVYITDGISTMHINDVAQKIGISRGAAHLRLKRGKLNGYTATTRPSKNS